MSDETKHTSRLPSYGQGAPRWIASQIYTRMLLKRPDLIQKVSVLKFGVKLPNDFNIGSVIYSEPGGMVYFNEDGGGVFILLTDDDDDSDETELAAGQVGPMGDM